MQYREHVPAPRRSARIGFLLSQLGSHASAVFAEQTAPLGVTPSEAGVIRIIAREPGTSQSGLAERLGIGQSRVVAILDRLEGAGLTTRTRRPGDRRVQEVALTDPGRELAGRLRQAAEAQESALTAGLDDADRERLAELLAQLVRLRGLDPDVHRGYRDRGA
jgi:DNA-binding MarR family transcriptional regulator